jgi:hypothetical protein
METDCPLPIPMHRPYITLDSRHDRPLPFRRALGKVTELTAENSTPYKLPTKHELSAFEGLPFEIRERIYMYLGLETNDKNGSRLVGSRHVKFFRDDRPWRSRFPEINKDVDPVCLYISRSIRKEVLDLLFGKVIVSFHFYLSDRKIYFDNWDNLYEPESELP